MARLAARRSREPVADKAFVQECLDVARQLLMQQRITSSESLSSELFSTGLRLARNRGLADPAASRSRPGGPRSPASWARSYGGCTGPVRWRSATSARRTRRHPSDRRSSRRPDRGQVPGPASPPPGPRRPAPPPGISGDQRRCDPRVHRRTRRPGRPPRRSSTSTEPSSRATRRRSSTATGCAASTSVPRSSAGRRSQPWTCGSGERPWTSSSTSRSRRSPGGWKTSWMNSANGCSGRPSPAGSTRRRASSASSIIAPTM